METKPILNMKKLYLFLISAILAICCSAGAQAQMATFKWEYPGAVTIRQGNINNPDLELPEDATSFTVPKEGAYYYVIANDGYALKNATFTDKNGIARTIDPATPYGKDYQAIAINLMASQNKGCEYTINVGKAVIDAKFTLDIENGADCISAIALSGGRKLDIQKGKQTIEFASEIENKVTISVANTKSIYSVKLNDTEIDVQNFYGSKSYSIDNIADGDVLSIRGYENGDPVAETCKMTVEIPENAKGALKQIWNNSNLKEVVADEDGTYTVDKGSIINLRFNEDYKINSIKVNDDELVVNGLTSSKFTVNADTHIVIDATPIEYNDVTWTVYIANPEGVNLRAGNGLAGYDLDLSQGGEAVDSDIEFKSASESGTPISPAMTVPGSQTYKYTFSVSSKYASLMYTPKEGYWIKGARTSSLSTAAENPVTDHTFYVYAKKIDRSAQAIVYLSTNGVNAIINGSGTDSRFTISQQGYNTLKFDPEYDTPFSGRFYTNAVEKPAVYLDGNLMKADENSLYSLTIKEGSVVKMFGDGKTHSESEIAIEAAPGATAEITYDKIKTADGTFKCFDGTEVTIVPGAFTTISIDGKPVEASAMSKAAATEGTAHTFTTTGAHKISLAYNGPAIDEYVLDPVSGSTVESLDQFTIAFPNATDVTVEMASDEILFMSRDQTYGAWNIAVEKVEEAECPTFRLTPSPAPTALKSYVLNIPAGFFKINGETNSSEIDANFTLSKNLSDIEVMFSPTGDVPVSEYPCFNIVFDESLQVSASDDFASKCTVTFDGETLTPDTDFMTGSEGNFFMIMLGNPEYFRPGALKVSLAEGALSLSGTPSPAIEHTWNLVEPKEYVCTITPDDTQTVTSLEKVTIVFENAETASIDNSFGVSLKGGTPGNADYYNQTGKITVVENEEHPTFDITFNPAPTNAGKYVLTIGYGVFYLDNIASYPQAYLTRTYTLSPSTGIEGVIADGEANGDIYNLQGVKLNSEWSDLPAGLYIVGGKKVMKH